MQIPPRRLRPRALRLTMGLVILCACGAVAAGAIASGTTRAASAKPRLVLISRDPAVVRGSGFRSHVRVRVTLVAAHRYIRRPRANRVGAFTATFPTVVDRCTTWRVSAVQRGAASVVIRGPRAECAPASTP